MFEALLLTIKKNGGGDTPTPGVTEFKGEIDQSSFITFTDLSTQLGVSGGTVINDTYPWLRFFSKAGQELYIPKRAIRSNLTWEYFNAKGLVTGTATIVISGKTYKVRFMLGAPADPGNDIMGREWNELIVPLTNGELANYTFADIGTGTSTTASGELTMLQEANIRGGHCAGAYRGIGEMWYQPTGQTNIGYGWRPVLELVP